MIDTSTLRAQATRIDLFDVRSVPMRTFHLSWLAFFVAFFGWFGIAPLMVVVREDLGLSRAQVGNTVIASVAVTVLARLVIGWLTDRIGPRKAYAGLLIAGSVPVACIGLAQSYEAFLLFRLAIGVIGASFVITQYHTSVMFAPSVVGTANATTAGWGNLGGGVTQIAMPLVLALFLGLGLSEAVSWRVAMVLPGVLLFVAGLAYWRYTRDTPEGNFSDLSPDRQRGTGGTFLEAVRDRRVWALFLIYGACFGVELTINNVAAIYFHDRFGLSVAMAGLIAGLFGLMNLFARTLGGVAGDRVGRNFGLDGRIWLLGGLLFLEGLALIAFSRIGLLLVAIPMMLVFSVFVQMSEGATFSIVPFVNRRALGAVSGIVGAGGNAGAVAFGFLFRLDMSMQAVFLIVGLAVIATSFLAPVVRVKKGAPAVPRWARSSSEVSAGGGD